MSRWRGTWPRRPDDPRSDAALRRSGYCAGMVQVMSLPSLIGKISLPTGLPLPLTGRASNRTEADPATIAGGSSKVADWLAGTNPIRAGPDWRTT